MSPGSASLRCLWDVFLNFRGSDTRDLTDFIKDWLQSINVRVFRDDDGVEHGDNIALCLSEAINSSFVFIVILSPNYASSSWCLDELAQICECPRLILPIFYGVEPSQVRHQKDPFQRDFRSYESRGIDTTRWRKAMEKVAGFRGYLLNGKGKDAHELRSLVQRASQESRINNTAVSAAELIGIEERVKELKELLEVQSNGVRILGLYGVGGVGKTTLAKSLFDSLVDQFRISSFVANVAEILSKNEGLISLQSKIINDLSLGEVAPLNDVTVGIAKIKRIIHENPVLLVLDDIVDVMLLDALIGEKEWFCEGSLMIITTRDGQVLSKTRVDLSYEVKELEFSEALELFSYRAMRRKEPPDNFLNHSEKIVSLIGGLPLALEAFGSFLFDKRKVEEWVDALGKLGHIRRGNLRSVLKLSFNGLGEEEKCVFLNIANLIIQMGTKNNDVMNVLRCYGFRGEREIAVLIEKGFIKIIEDGVLWMHDEIKDMGREIVLANSDMLGRLWDCANILAILKAEKDTAEAFNFVDDINPSKVYWKINVRIIRMWTVPDHNMNSETTKRIEMVLMDERGGRIHATIKGHLVSNFKSVVEGGVYQITNFEVEHNNGKCRTTRHKFKLNFLKQTTVTKSECEIPWEGFHFTSFAEIGSLKDKRHETFLKDVIGEVVGNSDIIKNQSRGKMSERMEIELKDLEGNKLKCILWDQYAHEMHSFLAEEKAGPIIVIIQLGRVKVHNDGLEITNAYGTKLLINSNVTTAIEYKNRVLHRKNSCYQRRNHIRSRLVDPISKNSMNVKNNKKTIDEILKALQPMNCFTHAKITEIQMRQSWWYISCKRCNTKVKQRGLKFFCKKCDKFVESTIPRFKVRMKVDDGTGTTTFVIFDPEATQIIGKSVTDIRQRMLKDGEEDMFPSELYELREKKYLFKVKIKENRSNYSVLEMTLMDGDNLIENSLPVTAKQESILNDTQAALSNKTPSKRLYSEAFVEGTGTNCYGGG